MSVAIDWDMPAPGEWTTDDLDALGDVVSDRTLVLNVISGLNERFTHVDASEASKLTFLPSTVTSSCTL